MKVTLGVRKADIIGKHLTVPHKTGQSRTKMDKIAQNWKSRTKLDKPAQNGTQLDTTVKN